MEIKKEYTISEKRNCFGTKEYSLINKICKTCPEYISCGEVKPKRVKQKNYFSDYLNRLKHIEGNIK